MYVCMYVCMHACMNVCICSQAYVHMIDTEHAGTLRSSHRAPYLTQCPPVLCSESRAGYEPTAYYALSPEIMEFAQFD